MKISYFVDLIFQLEYELFPALISLFFTYRTSYQSFAALIPVSRVQA